MRLLLLLSVPLVCLTSVYAPDRWGMMERRQTLQLPPRVSPEPVTDASSPDDSVPALSIAGQALATTTVDFDPPAFTAGQVVGTAGNVSFPDNPVVFQPSNGTATGPYALRMPQPCNDHDCTNNANQLRMVFAKGVSQVTLQSGLSSDGNMFAIPEGQVCVYARLVGFDGGLPVTSSPDVSIGCAVGLGYGSPINVSLGISDPQGRIREAVLYVGRNTNGSDLTSDVQRAQIDHLTYNELDAPPPPPPPLPDPPVVTIDSPRDGYFIDNPAFGVQVTGTVTAPAGSYTACVLANPAAAPAVTACSTPSGIQAGGHFGPVYIAPAQLQLGTNTISAFAFDLAGRMARADITVELPNGDVDYRVTAIEITQAIQLPDLPLNTVAAGATSSASTLYQGVRLFRGRPTIVRAFANRIGAGPPYLIRAELRLTTRDDAGRVTTFAGVAPDNPLRPLFRGPLAVSTGERAAAESSFVFTIPPTWLLGASSFDVQVTVNPAGPTNVAECPGCTVNNSFTLTDAPLEDRQAITISPVEFTWSDDAGTVTRPNPVTYPIFLRTLDVTPAAIQINPWGGTIDITDLKNSITKLDDLRHAALTRLGGFEISNRHVGYTIGVARGVDLGLEQLMLFGDPLRLQPMAVVNEGRPLTSVSHEFFHQLSYWHAGECRQDGGSWPDVYWPPDNRGYLEGVGLDPRKSPLADAGMYRIFLAGTGVNPPELFDLMSYCGGTDMVSWISVPNWNAFGSLLPNGLPVLPPGTADIQPAGSLPQAVSGDTAAYRVIALVHADGSARIARVDRVAERLTIQPQSATAYALQALDAEGRVVSRSLAIASAEDRHGDPANAVTLVSGTVGATGTSRIRLLRDSTPVAELARSARAPTIVVETPHSGIRLQGGDSLLVTWRAGDADGDTLEARIEYAGRLEGRFRTIALQRSTGHAKLRAALFPPSENGRLRITVSDGLNQTSSPAITLVVERRDPTVIISAPDTGVKVTRGSPSSFMGVAFDDEGNSLDGERLRWLVEGQPAQHGTMATFTFMRAGPARVRLSATDGRGRTRSADRVVEVVRPPLQFTQIDLPPVVGPIARSIPLRVAASAPATLRVAGEEAAVGPEPREIQVAIKPGRTPIVLELRLRTETGDSAVTTRTVLRSDWVKRKGLKE